jgi:hypothetical protein
MDLPFNFLCKENINQKNGKEKMESRLEVIFWIPIVRNIRES